MMRVILDVTCLMPQKISGIGVYVRELYRSLVAAKVDIYPVVKLSRILKPSFVENHLGSKAKPFIAPLEKLKKKSILQGPDFRLLSYSQAFFKVVTIHDLLVFHEGYTSEKNREYGQKMIPEVLYKGKPDVIVAPSYFVAEELRERFSDLSSKIKCIPHGADHFLKSSKSPKFSISSRPPYFLYIGHLEARKNVVGIIKSFEIFAQKHSDVRLVIAGKDGFAASRIYSYISNSPFRGRIDLVGFVSDQAISDLYRGAIAFVFPSFYEGFGFPILEAMSLDCPVITSDRGAMAEIASDAAFLVDPHSEENIAAAMGGFFLNPSLRQKYIEAGKTRILEYTWQRCVESQLEVFSSLS